MDNSPLVFILGMVFLAALVRILCDRADRRRIHSEAAKLRREVLDISWEFFGRGWFGEKNDRIYRVTVRGRKGRDQVYSCKTSMFSGVYWHSEEPVDSDEDVIDSLTHSRKIETSDIDCPKCGRALPHDSRFCSYCGEQINSR